VDQRATLHDVAELAGVSLASSSSALHGGGASRRMTDRVAQAATQLGYQVDRTGRALRTGRVGEVAVMVADIGNLVYVQLMQAVHDVVAEAGYQVIVHSTGDSADAIAAGIHALSAGFVDGIVLAPLWVDAALVDALATAPVPVVVVGPVDGSMALDSVWTDSAVGIGLAIDHLVQAGRKRLALINGPLNSSAGLRRERGFTHAMGRHQLTPASTQTATDFTMKAGAAACRDLLDTLSTPPDALVAANDMLAIGCIQALRQRGLSVPGDIAVVGMDNTEFGSVISPSLTSVDLLAGERGRQAAQLLLARIAGDTSPIKHLQVTPQLIIRDSTGGALS